MTVEMSREERIMAAAIIMRDAVEEMMSAAPDAECSLGKQSEVGS